MAANTRPLRKDSEGKPAPQYFNPSVDNYEVLLGRNGASRIELYDAGGNPVDLKALVQQIVDSIQESTEVSLTGSLPEGEAHIGEVSVKGSIQILGNETLFQGNVILGGEPVQLPSQPSKNLTIQAHPDNPANVYVGLENVDELNHMVVLTPGSSMTFYVTNTDQLYVHGTVGSRVSWGGEV